MRKRFDGYICISLYKELAVFLFVMRMNKDISIRIENFGPIKGPETIYLRPFMIFSGVSGIGKSYLAMLVHFVYRILCGNETRNFLFEKKINFDWLKINFPDEESVICKIQVSDFINWINERALFYMRDMTGNQLFNAKIEISLPDLPEYFTFLYGRNTVRSNGRNEIELVEVLKLVEDDGALQFPQSSVGSWGEVPFMILLNRFLQKKYELRLDKTFFMPPSRGSLVAVPYELSFVMNQSKDMYQEFLSDLSSLKTLKPKSDFSESMDSANKMLNKEVLHGGIDLKENELIYKIEGSEDVIPITAVASSIKEISPFALMIQKGLLGSFSILFEEPESHLHPELQLKVVDLLAYSLKEGAHLQITTHSDYILRHINDLIRLHILRGKMADDVKFKSYCFEVGLDPHIVIDPDLVNAYYLSLDSNGDSYIKKQDVSMGIPFDTFNKVMDEQIVRSAELYDKVEFYIESES